MDQAAPTFNLLLLSCVEILRKVAFSFSWEKGSWSFLGLPMEAEWGLPAWICVPPSGAAGPSAGSTRRPWAGVGLSSNK